jgi:hypothetical protein
MADWETAVHEAGHGVAGWTFNVEMHLVSIRQTEEHAGVTHFNASGFEDDVTCATILVAGEIAQRIASGDRSPRFNWLKDTGGGDSDAEKARRFCDRTSRPLLMRQLVELKASSLVHTRWRAVEAVAEYLERRTLILPADIDRLCREAGARKAGEPRRRAFDPDTHMVSLPGGKQVTMRKWADAVAASGFSKERAERLLGAK